MVKLDRDHLWKTPTITRAGYVSTDGQHIYSIDVELDAARVYHRGKLVAVVPGGTLEQAEYVAFEHLQLVTMPKPEGV